MSDPTLRPAIKPQLQREVFEYSRDREYFEAAELSTMTGQPVRRFPDVVVKELIDNALDATEQAGMVPNILLRIRRRRGRPYLLMCVIDNGSGIPPDVVGRILNFRTRTGDKAAYRSPTRRAQGNALKTIIGIPYALGSRHPLVIEAKGKKHIIHPQIDPAGFVRIDCRPAEVADRGGTRMFISLPVAACTGFDPAYWARAFSLFNPHAAIHFLYSRESGRLAKDGCARSHELYQPTVGYPNGWRKFTPTDLISPWWYDEPSLLRLVFSCIQKSRSDGGRDRPLREFVMDFPGLARPQKAKSVCARLPHISRLSDFEQQPEDIKALLKAMREKSRKPKPRTLGLIGKDHFRERFDRWYGVRDKRFWYEVIEGEADGLPFVFEAAIAQTERPGTLFYGVNFSPTFDDPLTGTSLKGSNSDGEGVRGFLSARHVFSHAFHSVAAIHLVCPATQPLDKGKTRLVVPKAMADGVTETLEAVTRVLHREEERRKKDAAKQQRADDKRERSKSDDCDIPLTEVMPLAMPKALEDATGGKYRVSRHTLFYSARRIFQKYTTRPLESQYFEQTLLTTYIHEHPEVNKLVYSEARGTLYEPHTRVVLPLGTREVESYRFPDWLYNKILFVEKQGLWPILQDAQLGERFDMAIVAAEGYATEACRLLFDQAKKNQKYQIFCLHDADPYGYEIARTLREETARMPGYSVEVIDLGLTLQDALDLNLEEEKATRKKALPKGLQLTAREREYFGGEVATRNYKTGKPTSWIYRRVELNAFTAPGLIAYTEKQLHTHKAVGKVIPPVEKLSDLVGPIFREIMDRLVGEEIDRLLSIDWICEHVAKSFSGDLSLEGRSARHWIEEALGKDQALSWKQCLQRKIDTLLRERHHDISCDVLKTIKDVIGDYGD